MIDAGVLQLLAIPLAVGVSIALPAGPLGALIVWRRMAYFSDTLGHSLLLGISISVLLAMSPWLGALACCTALSLLLLALQRRVSVNVDAILGVLSHSSLALGLILISVNTQTASMINQYLFGDILAADADDLYLTLGLVFCLLLTTIMLWRRWISITVHEDLARIEGQPIAALNVAMMLTLATLVAIAMQVVGVLLISALLIIPAVTARAYAKSPVGMALIASALAVVSVTGGLWLSYRWDTPAGPSIIAAAALCFAISLLRPRRA